MVVRMAPQVRGVFPLGEALQLAEALGYDGTVIAELLPAAAMAVTQTYLERQEHSRG